MKDNITGFTNVNKINQEAAQWVLLIEETPKLSVEQINALNEWVATSDVHKACLTNMASSWDEMELLSDVMLPQEVRKSSGKNALITSLLSPFTLLLTTIMAGLAMLSRSFRPIVIAPIVLCAFVFFIVHVIDPMGKRIVFITDVGEKLSHKLDDGSTLWLNSQSEVTVEYSKDFRRINLLRGEAHFEVAKDAARPFEVYADDRLVRAIGTAFSVHKVNNTINVLVSEGTVEIAIVDNSLVIVPNDINTTKDVDSTEKVSLEPDENTVILPTKIRKNLGQLTAGQRVTIPVSNDNIGAIVKLDSSEITRHLSWKEGKLVFAGEPLIEVIAEISRHTEIRIDVIDPKLETIRIGGQFQVGETDTLFNVLESGFGVHVVKLNQNHVQLEIKKN